MLRLSGIFPIPRECPLCGEPFDGKAVLLESEAMLVCRRCGRGHRHLEVGADELLFLERSGREKLEQIARQAPAASVLARIERLCARVRRQFLQAELRSYRVMRDTLASLS